MNKLIYTVVALMATMLLSSCSDEDWTYDKSQEHVYFFGPQVWGYDDTKKGSNNVVFYDIAPGATAVVPMQFWSEFTRSYDVTTYYYTVSDLVRGTDYEVVTEGGDVIQPDANGAYKLTWAKAVKGVQNVCIKSLPGGAKGTVTLRTHNPALENPSNQDVSSTIQNKTEDYEVRIFTQNYKVAINIK